MKNDMSNFVAVLSIRGRYSGEVSGMLEECLTPEKKQALSEKLCNELTRACRAGSEFHWIGDYLSLYDHIWIFYCGFFVLQARKNMRRQFFVSVPCSLLAKASTTILNMC